MTVVLLVMTILCCAKLLTVQHNVASSLTIHVWFALSCTLSCVSFRTILSWSWCHCYLCVWRPQW